MSTCQLVSRCSGSRTAARPPFFFFCLNMLGKVKQNVYVWSFKVVVNAKLCYISWPSWMQKLHRPALDFLEGHHWRILGSSWLDLSWLSIPRLNAALTESVSWWEMSHLVFIFAEFYLTANATPGYFWFLNCSLARIHHFILLQL